MNIAYGRLWWVIIGSFFASALPAFNTAWDGMPLRDDSTFGHVMKVASIASIEALRAGVCCYYGVDRILYATRR